MIDTIFVNGTVGVGKSSVADAISAIEIDSGTSHAVIDLDEIRRMWPAPHDDPFSHELELINLQAFVANYRAAGARHFILAGVIEHIEETARYRAALTSSGLLILRLEAHPTIVDRRLRQRHAADAEQLAWHLNRAPELAEILRNADLDDIVLDASTRSPQQLAERATHAAGWG